ncbi:hypothetical protein C8R43DRAFT_1243704 [Mycena crocata]|nr:hypothetical protein C8R43DRAFT_1243704 [Mycena crocata]
MSDHALPDEIISEILSPALKVSDDVFSDNSGVSPFANYSESPSAYLLVCKSWLRVATPLLYNVVILRSKAQAKALSQALSKSGELGQFIRKLRVEGGYGPSMHTILENSPNITDLFMSLEIFSSDNTLGLCKGLPLINPMCLILCDSKRLDNKMISQLIDALVASIRKWDRLHTFDCPYKEWGEHHRAFRIVDALKKSKRLQTFILPMIGMGVATGYSALKECPLQAIQIKQPSAVDEYRLKALKLDQHPKLKALLKLPEKYKMKSFKRLFDNTSQVPSRPPPHIAPSLNPSFIPMSGASKETQEMIWTRILYFAMCVPGLTQTSQLKDGPSKLPLLLVSQTWQARRFKLEISSAAYSHCPQRLGLPFYYAQLRLNNSSSLIKFLAVLRKHPFVGPHVRVICGDMTSSSFVRDEEDQHSRDLSVSTLLSQTTGLAKFYGWEFQDIYRFREILSTERSISWHAFEIMAKNSGSTLQEFSKPVDDDEHSSVAVFNDLTALRSLDWKGNICFEFDSKDPDPNAMPNLESLCVQSLDHAGTFLDALSLKKLESLKSLVLVHVSTDCTRFFRVHGTKFTGLDVPYSITKLLKASIFSLCPNVTCLSVFFDPVGDHPDAAYFSSPQACSLAKLRFNLSYWSKPKPNSEQWEISFTAFQPTGFPDLHEIQVTGCQWPTTEREIAKSHWVRWAELQLKRNINLTDKDGKPWRPRLKVK